MTWQRASPKQKVKSSSLEGNLKLSLKINQETQYDGFFGLVVEGVQRIGKSSYSCQGLACTLAT